MSNKSAIREFRKVVDTVIDNQYEAARERRTAWPEMDIRAKLGDISYESVDSHRGRSSVIGMGGEHRWGIVTPLQLGKYVGRVALVSVDNNERSLLRNWQIDTPLGGTIGVATRRELSTEEELELAVNWARSPHINTGAIKMLASLSSIEIVDVNARLAEHAVTAQQLQADLAEIDVARRRGWENARNDIIG